MSPIQPKANFLSVFLNYLGANQFEFIEEKSIIHLSFANSCGTISMELGKGPLVAVGLCHDLDAIRKISETRKKVGSPQGPASAFAP